MREDTAIVNVVSECIHNSFTRSATIYLSEKRTVRATRRHKAIKGSTTHELVLKVGKPNYREREFIKLCKKAGQKFPIRAPQTKGWPEKKKK